MDQKSLEKLIYKVTLDVCRMWNCYCTDVEDDRKGLALAISKTLAEKLSK